MKERNEDKRTPVLDAKVSEDLVLGLDFGSDSVRCALIDTHDGKELAISQKNYPRWEKGLYCDAALSQFRQHPLDYLETLEEVIKTVLAKTPGAYQYVKAMGIGMTGSTPVAVNKEGTPLSLTPPFAEDPEAMFIMWKDHTGREANERINTFSSARESDYTRSRLSGSYSIEHFWTKALHVFRNKKIRAHAHSFVESSDWLPGELTGNTRPEKLKRGMGIASSRVLWNRAWGGYPPDAFFAELDPVLKGLVNTFDPKAYTCDEAAGYLSKEWAERLGLGEDVVVSVGNLDCHAGAIGAGVKEHSMVEILGTSTVAITVGAFKEEGVTIPGVPQQALNMILPGEMGYEGGQSAFGDLYNWFKKVLLWPTEIILANTSLLDAETKKKLIREIDEQLLPALTKFSSSLPLEESNVISTDWINGRRSPDVDFDLKGTIAGLKLSNSAPHIYKSLVEATAYGAKAFIEKFQDSGGRVDEVIAVGGISKKSPFVMQVLADVIGVPIKVLALQQACSTGVAMCAATAAGIFPSIQKAQEAMASHIDYIYTPNLELTKYYDKEYRRYQDLEKVKEIIA